jgi:hypothetical protein
MPPDRPARHSHKKVDLRLRYAYTTIQRAGTEAGLTKEAQAEEYQRIWTPAARAWPHEIEVLKAIQTLVTPDYYVHQFTDWLRQFSARVSIHLACGAGAICCKHLHSELSCRPSGCTF